MDRVCGDLDLLVLGEINPDIVVTAADPRPIFGQAEKIVDTVRLTIGSSSAIFACGAARLGLRTGFFGVVGDDALGRFMLEAMSARGVDVSACVVDASRPTGASVILTAPDDRAILTAIGTIEALDVDALPPDLLRRARHVHMGSYFLQQAGRSRLPDFFRSAQQAGLTTSFDCNWDPTGRWDGGVSSLLSVTDVFLPNASEALHLTQLHDVEAAARELARRGAVGRLTASLRLAARMSGDRGREHGREGPELGELAVVVKLGADGAVVVRGDEVVKQPALPVAPVDTTGAGDSFDAGFLFAWLTGRSLEHALALGVACGSISTQQVGGTEAQPTIEQARAAIAHWRR
jgi:sugar/nucleoside kinase (ribokinase family)